MPDSIDNVEEFSPYKLLLNFSTSRVLPCLFIAIVVHALIIGGFSTSYIYHTWINPSAVADEEGNGSDDPKPDDAVNPADKPADGQPVAPAEDGKPADSTKKDGDKPPVVERVSDKPKPDEIPTEPGGLGLPIDGLD